ncbi:hypothetical protein DN752_04415 [Echinicola strongylocentroti]|uniref:Winged helix-turn-helix transcriptional regulator n=1 Tax=Echinicola strongylocentroti TaxID=1795355 RepID=A0A2Z4IFI0_9BACT|nr:winged helix-turn-helix transcriptional regulator [Echinicola strongylocentroti]AWW29447.1 hypothetical protein DN752_04415 [Echinicola strongylocentroti]
MQDCGENCGDNPVSNAGNAKIAIKELGKLTGLTRQGVEYNIKKLNEEGRIERIGPDKGGSWKVLGK